MSDGRLLVSRSISFYAGFVGRVCYDTFALSLKSLCGRRWGRLRQAPRPRANRPSISLSCLYMQARIRSAAFAIAIIGLVSLNHGGAVGVLRQAVGNRDIRVTGRVALALYGWTYQRHMMGYVRPLGMFGSLLARWVRSRILMPVRWY